MIWIIALLVLIVLFLQSINAYLKFCGNEVAKCAKSLESISNTVYDIKRRAE